MVDICFGHTLYATSYYSKFYYQDPAVRGKASGQSNYGGSAFYPPVSIFLAVIAAFLPLFQNENFIYHLDN